MSIGNAGIGSAGLSPSVSIGGAGISKGYLRVVFASAEATGTTEITFTVVVSPLAYAGVEWSIDPVLTWTAFDASQATSHIIIIDGADGVVAGTTYAWRSYATNDPLDAPSNRVYGVGGTIEVPADAAQYMMPGIGYVNTNAVAQYMIPGAGYINE